MKIAYLLLPLLLLTGCGKTEGLAAVPDSGFLPADVAPGALTEVINYENLNRFGEKISAINAIENSARQIKLRVVTGDVESLFTLKSLGKSWQIVDVQ